MNNTKFWNEVSKTLVNTFTTKENRGTEFINSDSLFIRKTDGTSTVGHYFEHISDEGQGKGIFWDDIRDEKIIDATHFAYVPSINN